MKKIKQLFGIKIDDYTVNSTIRSEILSETVEPRESNSVSIQKLIEEAKIAMVEAKVMMVVAKDSHNKVLRKIKVVKHVNWLEQMQKVRNLEEQKEKANAKHARLVAENSFHEVEIRKLKPRVAEKNKLSARLKQVESKKIKLKLKLSTIGIMLQRYTEPTVDVEITIQNT